ncbi:unnamed protein product [Didymodactylos carnosus]|uniref:Methyltransferase domain-containing protein n=1 Tax=Didymodactylos carnosus TaxID=1234261 RepID=A0A815D510_9BILA|nr:unnamed protein product [Didymodactylos carnosus]CAF4104409.1 unnamed protein product [Didymodactylos carnosus]
MRPEIVQTTIDEKYLDLQQNPQLSKWTNMGKNNEMIFLNKEGAYIETNDLIFKFMDDNIEHRHFLDLGTGNAELLLHVNKLLNIPFDCIFGISAVDHRPVDSLIPNTSYFITNIDNLNEWSNKITTFRYSLIVSSSTFYHLVDPLTALETVYDLLEINGLAIIRHIPLSILRINAQHLELLLRRQGHTVCVIEMMNSSGNYLLATVRRVEIPELILPFQYTGDITQVDFDLDHSRCVWKSLIILNDNLLDSIFHADSDYGICFDI